MVERGESFKEHFIERLNMLRAAPYKFGQLTVRSLLDTREQFLVSFSFCDPYLQVKSVSFWQFLQNHAISKTESFLHFIKL